MQKLESSLNMKIYKKGCHCVPLPPKGSEGVAQKWNILHVLTGNMFTQMPWRCRHRGFGHVQSQGTETRWQVDKISIWGEKELVTKAMCVRSRKHSVAGAESHLLSLYVRADSLFTPLDMGKFLRQFGGRRRSGDRSFQPSAPSDRGQISSQEKLWSPSWTHHRARGSGRRRIPPGCWQGYSRGSLGALNLSGEMEPKPPISVRKPIPRKAEFLPLNSSDAEKASIAGSAPGTRPRRHGSPRTAAGAFISHQLNKGSRTKSLVPRLPLHQADYLRWKTKPSKAKPLRSSFASSDLGRISPAPPEQRLCSPAGTRQNRGKHPDKEGEASGDERDREEGSPVSISCGVPAEPGGKGGLHRPHPSDMRTDGRRGSGWGWWWHKLP